MSDDPKCPNCGREMVWGEYPHRRYSCPWCLFVTPYAQPYMTEPESRAWLARVTIAPKVKPCRKCGCKPRLIIAAIEDDPSEWYSYMCKYCVCFTSEHATSDGALREWNAMQEEKE